jgi:hypothetical protein
VARSRTAPGRGMAHYNVTLIYPPAYRFAYLLTDICRFFAFGLRELGHRADITVNHMDNAATNVIVGTHLMTAANVAAVTAQPTRYIALESELLSLGASGEVVSSFQGDAFAPTLGPLFARAEAVWDPFHANIAMLRRLGVPAQRIKFLSTYGYAADMHEIRHRPWDEKDIDVLFFGSVTERRAALLSQLERRMRVVAILDAPAAFRNDLIARAKLNVNLNATDGYTHMPLTRVSYLLNNAGVIVSEPVDTNPELHPMISFTPKERLVEACMSLLVDPATAELGEKRLEQFKQLPMAEALRTII